MRVFVDSNIPMYVAGKQHPLRDPARRFLVRVRSGEVEACTSTEVLQEILYRYVALKRPDLAREIYELFADLCHVILPVTLPDTDRAKDMLAATMRIGVRDAIHAAVMLNNDGPQIATVDRGFDAIAGVKRVKLG